MKIEIKCLKGCGMSFCSLDFAKRLQMIYNIPVVNVCFSPDELLKKVKEAEEKEKFILIEL